MTQSRLKRKSSQHVLQGSSTHQMKQRASGSDLVQSATHNKSQSGPQLLSRFPARSTSRGLAPAHTHAAHTRTCHQYNSILSTFVLAHTSALATSRYEANFTTGDITSGCCCRSLGITLCPTYLVFLQGEDESLIKQLALFLLVGDFEVHAIEEVLCKIIARPEHRVLELWP